MLTNAIDLTALLESPGEEFLLRAFRETIGREADVGSFLHYIGRLKKGCFEICFWLKFGTLRRIRIGDIF